MSIIEQKPKRGDRFVNVTTSPYVITESSGTIFSNAGATGTIIFLLPPPGDGLQYSFLRNSNQDILIQSSLEDGDNEILPDGGLLFNKITLQENGAVITLVSSGTEWFQEFKTPASVQHGNVTLSQILGSGGEFGAFIARTEKTTYAWGEAAHGQLGDDSTVDKLSPISVLGDYDFKLITAGQGHCVALDKNNFAWSWGRDTQGRLGRDTNFTNQSSPVSVVGGHKFTTVSNNHGNHTLALDESGFAWGWGGNNNGQLGNDDQKVFSEGVSSPVSVVGGRAWSKIAAGSSHSVGHSLGIDENGFTYSWGNNVDGQLGHDDTVQKSSPVSVLGGHLFQEISTGQDFSSALDTDGYAWTWGKNQVGQLGNDLGVSESSPVSVVGDHKFTKISSGLFTTIALDEGGFAWTWGSGINGRLGNDATDDQSSPVSVVGGLVFTDVAAGSDQTYCLEKNTGTVWSWGGGFLGDGTLNQASSPVSVIRAFTI